MKQERKSFPYAKKIIDTYLGYIASSELREKIKRNQGVKFLRYE